MTKADRKAPNYWNLGLVIVFVGFLLVEGNSVLGIAIIIAGAFLVVMGRRTLSFGNRVTRPTSTATAYPAPPPPDTIMVKCEFCGTVQPFKEKCVNCGAPLPRP